MKTFLHQSLCIVAAMLATSCLTIAASNPPAITAAVPLLAIAA